MGVRPCGRVDLLASLSGAARLRLWGHKTTFPKTTPRRIRISARKIFNLRGPENKIGALKTSRFAQVRPIYKGRRMTIRIERTKTLQNMIRERQSRPDFEPKWVRPGGCPRHHVLGVRTIIFPKIVSPGTAKIVYPVNGCETVPPLGKRVCCSV